MPFTEQPCSRAWRFICATIAIFGFTQSAFSEQTYEAESAVLLNGAQIADCSSCSGGAQVKNIGGEDNGAVLFTNIHVTAAGLYPMTVCFKTSDDRSFAITVNHESIPRALIFRRTGDRDEVSRQTVSVPLRAGSNSIRFDNPSESGPELDKITVADSPIESHNISGQLLNENSQPLANAEIFLSGNLDQKTVTDANGNYEFDLLPGGNYYVTPSKASTAFLPCEAHVSNLSINLDRLNFIARPLVSHRQKTETFEAGNWRIEYDLAGGTFNLFWRKNKVIANAYTVVRTPETLASTDFEKRTASQEPFHDVFGSGIKVVIESSNSAGQRMLQTFWFYSDNDCLLAEVKLVGNSRLSANYIAPLVSHTPVSFLAAGDNRVLKTPFDNDKWVRYNAAPFGARTVSCEVSAFYNNENRQALVVGSVDHDTWKSGVKSETAGRVLQMLEVFGGNTSSETRDTLPHGSVVGETIASPRMFIGCFSDWRSGLETYARANAAFHPPRAWGGGVPFGWNSWGKLKFNISFQKALEVSDFIAAELQTNHFENNNLVYVGLDSGWNRLTDEQLKSFVEHCRSNHQEAGVYWTPFTAWRRNGDGRVEGADFQYKDILLYAHGAPQSLDGGLAVDPTHPGTKARNAFMINRFKRAGFKYLKIDFLTHGALEADSHYNTNVTTGIQAFNEGMQSFREAVGDDMYLNEAISPLFPSQYSQSRRIACDTFGEMDKIEYTLNSLTYGWWLGGVYDFNDADHDVLGGYSEGENRARITSSVITGIYILGDDFSADGDAEGKKRAKQFATNKEINDLARIGKPFRPVEGNTGNRAANMFVREDPGGLCLAVFNYSSTNATFEIDPARIGLNLKHPLYMKELWSGATKKISGRTTIKLNATDAAVYKFYDNARAAGK